MEKLKSSSGLGDSNYSITTDDLEQQSLNNSTSNINNISEDSDVGSDLGASGNLKKKFTDDDDCDKDGDKDGDEKSTKKPKDKSLHRFYKPPFFIKDPNTVRIISMVWGLIAIVASGTIYGFSIISSEVRDTLGYTQTDIGLATSLGDVGVYIGVTVGYFFDVFGPFYTNLLATGCYLLGYMGIWGILNGTVLNNVYLLSFFLFIVGQGSNAAFTACLVPNVHNFTIEHRGKISGVLVGMFALSAGIFGLIYKGTFGKTNDVKGYLLFLSILLAITSLVATVLVRLVKIQGVVEPELEKDRLEKEKNNKETTTETDGGEDKSIPLDITTTKGFDEENTLGSSGSGIIGDRDSDQDGDQDKKKEGKFKIIFHNLKYNNNNNNNKIDQSSYLLLNKNEDDSSPAATALALNPNYMDGKRDISGIQLLLNIEFWLLWIIYFFGAGGSLMFLNNVGVMGEALHYSDSVHSDLVIIFAVGNLIGRVGMGFVSDLISKRFSRYWCVVLSSIIVGVTHFICAFALKPFFYPATILTGIGYGGIVSIMVSLTSLRFGPRRFGLNFGCLAFSSAAAALIFSTVSSKIYDNLSEKEPDGVCYGNKCFRLSFIISFVCNLTCILIGIFLIFYNRYQLKKVKL